MTNITTAQVKDAVDRLTTEVATSNAGVTAGKNALAEAQVVRDEQVARRDEALALKADMQALRDEASGLTTYAALEKIVQERTHTVKSIFVYDTTKDSDGGAWRKRCQHTTWYREDVVPGRFLGVFPSHPAAYDAGGVAGDFFLHENGYFYVLEQTQTTFTQITRGNRREFPALAVIVAEESRVVIYDGDDPSLPMWMVFTSSEYNSLYNGSTPKITDVAMLNGRMAVAKMTVGGLIVIDFLYDGSTFIQNVGHYAVVEGLVNRNAGVGSTSRPVGALGINATVRSRDSNAVSMAVVPNSRVDPVTKLPVPTIAVAASTGLSVITEAGTLLFGANDENVTKVTMNEDQIVWINSTSDQHIRTAQHPLANNFVADRTYNAMRNGGDGFPRIGDSFFDNELALTGPHSLAAVYRATTEDEGLFLLRQGHSDSVTQHGQDMVAQIASHFNTGWQYGDIRATVLCSTDATPVVGGSIASVTDSTWTDHSDAGGSTSVVGDELHLINDTGTARSTTPIVFEQGERYLIECEVLEGTVSFYSSGGTTIIGTVTGPLTMAYQALTTDDQISIRNFGDGTTARVKNLSVKRMESDRSPSARVLEVVGTINRTPVAEGAELCGYGPFNSSNYMELSGTGGMNYGTGDFCVYGWWLDDNVNGASMFGRSNEIPGTGYGTNAYGLLAAQGFVRAYIGEGTKLDFTTPLGTGKWRHIAMVRRSGVLELWLDGILVGSVANTTDVNFAEGAARLGQRFYGDNWSVTGGGANGLAMWRTGATAPTPDIMRKIYHDELRMFQPHSACTLYGRSERYLGATFAHDVAYDESTGLVHVGTTVGRNSFDGLIRVDHDENPVADCIAAAAGMVVSQ